DFEGALAAYEQVLARADSLGDTVLKTQALAGLGMAHRRLGDFHQAVSLYTGALELCRDSGGGPCEAQNLHNLGSCYTALGAVAGARDALEEALELWPVDAFERSGTRTALATLDDLEGNHDLAIEGYREALILRRFSRGVEPRRRKKGLAATLDRLATAYKNAGRLEEARRAYERALELWEESASPSQYALTRSNLGWLLLESDEPARAMELFLGAKPVLEEAKNAHDLAFTSLGMAAACLRQGELQAAEAEARKAVEIVESLRSTSYSPLLRSSFLATREPFFEVYVEILMRLHEADPSAGFDRKALEVGERFRARGLLELLSVERRTLRDAADGPTQELEAQLHREMAAADHRHLELKRQAAPVAEIARVEKEKRGLALRYDRLRSDLLANHPGGALPDSLTPPEMMGLLGEDTLLLSYFLGTERSFLWRVSSDGVETYDLPGRAVVEEEARKVYRYLSSSDQRGGQAEGREALERLSRLLLDPVKARLGRQRLLIVAGGFLHYIPFAALSTAGGEPLVMEHEIVALPSASVLQVLRDRASSRRPAAHRLAVVADPVFRRDDPRLPGETTRVEAEDAEAASPARLERSGQEARAILSLADAGDRFAAVGFDATREAVLGGKLADFQVVHIATHGVLNDEQPEYTHLVLSLVDRQGRTVEGRLYQHEIGGLELSADLVVLSACNSALGKNVRGEGLMGMTRGFMDAGASSVLVSLWYVSEEATALLMERFYAELLLEGKTPSAALQSAQTWLRSQPRWEAPFYWAGFILQGEWR
ncbi:MAG: CHAT domain-containing protein, partial [Acidobacteria bacterium]|nr:CHAT domain-containing protein [Acidobacteriota bacterium]